MIKNVTVTFFSVGRGDASVFEIHDDDNVYYIIYDICRIRGFNPIAEYLINKTDTVHAVIISHMHRDHISGINEIFEQFKVKELYLPPYFHVRTKSLDKILTKYREEIKRKITKSSDSQNLHELSDFSRIIHEVNQYCKGQSTVYVNSLEGIERPFYLDCNQTVDLGSVFLPMNKFTARISKFIEDSEHILDSYEGMNDSSISILFTFFRWKLLVTGDSQKKSWYELKGRFRNRIQNFDLDVLKVAHHGSEVNTDPDLLSFFYSQKEKRKFAIISGDGKKHPAKELLSSLGNMNVEPFCTGLSVHCVPKLKLLIPSEINSYFTEFLINYDIFEPVKCQGNITITMDENHLEIHSETNNFCPYHLPQINSHDFVELK